MSAEPEFITPFWQLRRDDETRDEYVERMLEYTRAVLADSKRPADRKGER